MFGGGSADPCLLAVTVLPFLALHSNSDNREATVMDEQSIFTDSAEMTWSSFFLLLLTYCLLICSMLN